MNITVCYLTEQFRQQDLNFLNVLNDIRSNEVSDTALRLLTSRFNKPVVSNLTPTKLYTHNVDVDAINSFELGKIDSEPKTYTMQCSGEAHLIESLKKGCLAPEKLILKKDSVVMFVKNNFDRGYVNGTLGWVIGFDEEGYPIIKTIKGREIAARPSSWTIEENDIVKAEISQVPLRLAWAITVHKSQGMSLDVAEIDLSKSFTFGMGYVALSRVRTLNGIKLMGLNDLALRINKDVVDLDKQLYQMSKIAADDLHKMVWLGKRREQKKFLQKVTTDNKSENSGSK